MLKQRVAKIIYGIVAFIMFFTIFLAMLWSPREHVQLTGQKDDIEKVLEISDISNSISCSVAEDGEISINGNDAYIIFNVDSMEAKTLVVHMNKTIDKNIDAQLFLDYGSGMNENDSVRGTCFAGESTIGFKIPSGKFKQIRLDIDDDYSFKCIEIHENDAIAIRSGNTVSYKILMVCFLLSGFFVFLIIFIDYKTKYLLCIYKKIIDNKKIIIIECGSIGLSIVVGWLVEHIICGDTYNYAVHAFISGIILIICLAIIHRKILDDKPEIIFSKLIFISAMVMLISAPIGHIGWDLDSHCRYALQSSSFEDVGISEAELDVIINNNDFLEIPNNIDENNEKIQLLDGKDTSIVSYIDSDIRISSLLSGVVIAVFRLFGVSFFLTYKCGQIPIIIVYTLCCYYAMRRLHSGKMILATIAMFPTLLFISSNYSYDTWVVGFIFLGMAYFVGNCQEEGKISYKDAIIMVCSFAIAIIPKQIYVAVLLIPFFMPKKKMQSKKRYYAICSGAFAIMLVDLLVRTFSETSKGGDVRGGLGVDPVGQIKYILTNPFEYAHTLLDFLKDYLSLGNTNGYMNNFAYLGVGAKFIAIIILIILIFTIVTDKKKCDVNIYSKVFYGYSIVMFAGTAALVATSLYIAYTQVGELSIAGCQPRYLIPIIYPLASVIGFNGIRLKINQKVYNAMVLGIMQIIVLYCIYNFLIVRML